MPSDLPIVNNQPAPASAHTPGPWRSEMHSLYETNIVAGHKVVATIYGDGVGEEAASARLIAAAPDLLETLREYAVGCHACIGSGISPNGSPCYECRAARAAIRKAEGHS